MDDSIQEGVLCAAESHSGYTCLTSSARRKVVGGLLSFMPCLVLQVLDARDPLGTRCRHLEQHIKKNARHKHMLLLINKCDLVMLSCDGCRLQSALLRPFCIWTVYGAFANLPCLLALSLRTILRYVFSHAAACLPNMHQLSIKCTLSSYMTCKLMCYIIGASMGDQTMARVPEWGVPLPGFSCQHHQPFWQGQPAEPASPAVTPAHRQEVHQCWLCWLPKCWQVLCHQHTAHQEGEPP